MLILTALISALAGGAVWVLVASAWPGSFDAAALPIALALGLTLRATAKQGWLAALLAALATLLAAWYAAGLVATTHLAIQLGIPVRDVLLHDGVMGLIALSGSALHRSDLPWLMVAAVLAATTVLWPRPQAAATPRAG